MYGRHHLSQDDTRVDSIVLVYRFGLLLTFGWVGIMKFVGKAKQAHAQLGEIRSMSARSIFAAVRATFTPSSNNARGSAHAKDHELEMMTTTVVVSSGKDEAPFGFSQNNPMPMPPRRGAN